MNHVFSPIWTLKTSFSTENGVEIQKNVFGVLTYFLNIGVGF